MSPYDNASRIPKQAFIVSTTVLFAICLVSACARYYIRIRVQKEFSSDDGILLFGIACLITAMGLVLSFIDKMYVVGASESGDVTGVPLPSNFIQQAFSFQELVTVSLVLTWTAIVSVKFSYLFLFRRLISRMPRMKKFWWFATTYNAMISIYGAIVYGVACPEYYSLKALQCAFGQGVQRSIAFSQSQMVLDIVGDLFIIFIPFCLIWSVKICWTQKVALASTLCLTILTIICTIIRIAGIHTGRKVKSIDSVWETYWQFIAANIAVTMTAATAFRTFFVARAGAKIRVRGHGRQNNSPYGPWYSKGRRLLGNVFSNPFKKSRSHSGVIKGAPEDVSWELREDIPRATMTGMRTYIEKVQDRKGHVIQSQTENPEEERGEGDQERWHLSPRAAQPGIDVEDEGEIIAQRMI